MTRLAIKCHDGWDSADLWDTAGQERFSSMHPSYYYRAHACILVFDVTRKPTYKNLAEWYGELRQYCEGVPCLLVANKIDVDYNVREEEALLLLLLLLHRVVGDRNNIIFILFPRLFFVWLILLVFLY